MLAARALFDGPALPVAVRVAEHGGAYYLDLADPEWDAVRIGPDGWQIVASPPVRFIRPRGVLALPEPVTGGPVDELRDLINIGDDP